MIEGGEEEILAAVSAPKVEIGLKAVLAECVEALRERLHDGEQQARDLQQQITGCRWNNEKPPCPGLKPDLDAVDVENSRTRAALAVVELWAAVDVKPFTLGRDPGPAGFYERDGLRGLAIALECRRRNGEA